LRAQNAENAFSGFRYSVADIRIQFLILCFVQSTRTGIKEYLASDNRHQYIFADDWRRTHLKVQE
jgi:hypothetical protein